MASHFGNIGLEADSADAFSSVILDLCQRASPAGPAAFRAPESRISHRLWVDPSGAAMAIHLRRGTEIACVTPFFVAANAGGPTRWRVHTSEPYEDADCTDCGGADCDVLDERGSVVTRSTVQWLYARPYKKWLSVPRSYDITVVAFAHAARFCADEETFEAAQRDVFGEDGDEEGKSLRLADTAFLPVGMFSPTGATTGDRAVALFTGTVTQATLLTNQHTERPYWHVRVATLPGAVDVVLSPDLTTEAPEAGKRALVQAWLVGDPVSPEARPTNSPVWN